MTSKFFSFAVLIGALNQGSTADCSRRITLNLAECCTLPIPRDVEVYKDIAREVYKINADDYKAECKLSELYYQKSKFIGGDNAINLVAVQSYFDTNIEEDVWRKILKPVAEDCLRILMPNWKEKEAKIEFPPFNLKKNECNPLAMSFNTCITLEAFKKCPQALWTDDKKCLDGKAWVNECSPNVLFLVEFAPKRN